MNPKAKSGVHPGQVPIYGVVLEQMVRCGKANCHCADGVSLHGPYFYRFWRDEKDGRLRKVYVRKADVERVRAACAASRQNLAVIQAIRREIEEANPLLREANRWMRVIERQARMARQAGLTRAQLPNWEDLDEEGEDDE